MPPKLQKDRDTLIEKSNILLKQSVGQFIPCGQRNKSGYATGAIHIALHAIFITECSCTLAKLQARPTMLKHLSSSILNLEDSEEVI